MIPIPQSPWTLAIAELIGMRLATLGSSAHPADLLANLLPNGDALPEGWFDQFVAGTPIPGWSPSASSPNSGTPADVPSLFSELPPTPSSPPSGSTSAGGRVFADLQAAVQQAQTSSGLIPAESLPSSRPGSLSMGEPRVPASHDITPFAFSGHDALSPRLPGELIGGQPEGGAPSGAANAALAPPAAGAAFSAPPAQGAASAVSRAARMGLRAGKFLNVSVHLDGMPQELDKQFRRIAKEIARSEAAYIIFRRH
jgi:hypothetical protein